MTKKILGEVLTEIKNGIGDQWERYPVLGVTTDGLAPAKEPVGKNPGRYKPVFPRTVFYNPMRILIGSIGLVDDNDQPGITSPDYVVLKGIDGEVDTRWFYYWLRSPYGVSCIQTLARGAVRERMLFNRLAQAEVELPDFEVQLKMSAALGQVHAAMEAHRLQWIELQALPNRIISYSYDQGI